MFLSISYFLHLIATVIWLGGLALLIIFALPALRSGEIDGNRWLQLQQRFLPWANGSLVILLLTGFFQMTNDPDYAGFLVLDGTWAWAMLLKHIAYVGMVAITFYLQFILYPEIERYRLLQGVNRNAESRNTTLIAQDKRLLWLNFGCALLVLLFTAIMTAV